MLIMLSIDIGIVQNIITVVFMSIGNKFDYNEGDLSWVK